MAPVFLQDARMARRSVAGTLARLARLPPADGDADLLGRFVRDRDGEAFAGLVRRHGPMVLGVCRRTLGPGPDADDAFQATFLVLVRKAKTVSPPGAVGPWLYGVAARTAARARVEAARRRGRHKGLTDVPDPRPPDPGPDDLAAVIDAELARLPEAYRAAVVLCELDGLSLKAAAARLGVPAGTVASRLARGRKLLAGRLAGRGLALPAGGLAAWFAGQARAVVPNRLADSAAAVSAAASPQVANLASGVVKVMLAHKLKAVGRVALAVGFVGVGAATMTGPAAVSAPPERLAVRRNTAPVKPAPMVGNEQLEAWWGDLMKVDPPRTRAVLRMSTVPNQTVAFLKGWLRPLKLSREEFKKRLADLCSANEEVWKPAAEFFEYYDPRLCADIETLFAEAATQPERGRLVMVMATFRERPEMFDTAQIVLKKIEDASQQPPLIRYNVDVTNPAMRGKGIPFTEGNFSIGGPETVTRASWYRAITAITLLEHIGTPDAVAVIKDMATGHPDAGPTKAAKDALARLEKGR